MTCKEKERDLERHMSMQEYREGYRQSKKREAQNGVGSARKEKHKCSRQSKKRKAEIH